MEALVEEWLRLDKVRNMCEGYLQLVNVDNAKDPVTRLEIETFAAEVNMKELESRLSSSECANHG